MHTCMYFYVAQIFKLKWFLALLCVIMMILTCTYRVQYIYIYLSLFGFEAIIMYVNCVLFKVDWALYIDPVLCYKKVSEAHEGLAKRVVTLKSLSTTVAVPSTISL